MLTASVRVRRCWVAVLVLLATSCVLCSCVRQPAAKLRPNVLLIVVDALRADHLGAYGYQRPTSPNVDALAARGTLFLRAHSTTSWTDPAVESLFTGEFPRVLQPGAKEFISRDTKTLAEAFRAGGYRTGAIVANPALPADAGFAQGFDYYFAAPGWAHEVTQANKQLAEQVNAAGLSWLQGSDQRPWFLYSHYMDTHWPYVPPPQAAQSFWHAAQLSVADVMMPLNQRLRERPTGLSPEEVRESIDLYDAAIFHFDTQLATLISSLDAIGQLSNTLICITADHGEEFGDHDGFLHARTLYEEVIRIPLLIVPPGGAAGARVDEPAQISDIGRTLLDAAALKDMAFAGKSLDGRLGPSATSRALIAELMPLPLGRAVHERALLLGNDKLIVTRAGKRLLFDIRADPGEHHDASAERPELLAQLDQLLARSLKPHQLQPESAVSGAARERMRALGYDF